MIKLNLTPVLLVLAQTTLLLSLAACGGGGDDAAAAITQTGTAPSEGAQGRRRPPAPGDQCKTAAARLAQLQAEGRALDAEYARVLAEYRANDAGNGTAINLTLAEQQLAQLGDIRTKQNANSQAKYDLSSACGLPFPV